MMNKEVIDIMNRPNYIRNISIIAHVDHGKTALTESLSHVHMDVGEEKERGITIKSAAVSLKLGRVEKSKDGKKKMEREYLINLIDSPGHVDFSSEVTAALRITDGAICVIDCIEGVCVQTETVLRQAIAERVKPVLFLNKIDRIWLEKQLSVQETYNLFRRTIESTNVIISSFKDETLGEIELIPHRNSVAFGSGYFGWGFTINDFAKWYGNRFALSPQKMARKLWGNHFYDDTVGEWRREKKDESQLNGFCQFILRPLEVLHDAIMKEEVAVYVPILDALRLGISKQELADCDRPKDVLRLVMSRWLPAKQCVLDLAADQLPSPVEAQQYRVPNLYTGPMDTKQAADMMHCDPNGTLSMYISKMIPIKKDPGRFIAFGRVFSGTIKRGQDLSILGSDSVGGSNDGMKKRKVQGIVMMMGSKVESLSECRAGNVCGVMGIDRYLTKSGTLSDSAQCFPFKSMSFSVSPVVKVAVNVVDSRNLAKLIEGLRRLTKYDGIVQVERNKQGQHIVAGAGDLHLETCLKTLREDFMPNIAISTGTPIVSYCEGIGGPSGSTPIPPNQRKGNKGPTHLPSVVIGKSPNKLNRIYLTMEPLSESICRAIENGEVSLSGDMKAFARDFVARFGSEWDGGKESASRIWSFGGYGSSRCNVLVNMTKGANDLDKVRNHILDGFEQMTGGGVLGDEPLRGVRVNLVDIKIHPDSAHHGAAQMVPAMVRAIKGGLLSSTPTLLEPLYSVQIEVPSQCNDAMNGVMSAFGMVRGEILSIEDGSERGIPLIRISGEVPIVETLTNEERCGFNGLLRGRTKGKAFAVFKFARWKALDGDPMSEGNMANETVMAIRERKGMKMEMPSFYDFAAKI